MSGTACRNCAGYWRIIHAEVRVNESRQRRGLAVDLTAIEQAKADLAGCREQGHRGPEWQRRIAQRESA